MTLEFQILGPLEARRGETRLTFRGQRQRLLLATLLLNVNQVVSSDRLIEGALGRSPALGDLGFEVSLQAEIARLEELRLATFEDRVDADLALRRHAELIAELEPLAAANPSPRAHPRPAHARAVPDRTPGRGAGRLPRARLDAWAERATALG